MMSDTGRPEGGGVVGFSIKSGGVFYQYCIACIGYVLLVYCSVFLSDTVLLMYRECIAHVSQL